MKKSPRVVKRAVLAKSARLRKDISQLAKEKSGEKIQTTPKTSENLESILVEVPTIFDWDEPAVDPLAELNGPDMVNHPPHYTTHPSGVECIDITEHMNFCRGNAIKYIWRAGEKGDTIEDLKKARWYLDREIQRLRNGEW